MKDTRNRLVRRRPVGGDRRGEEQDHGEGQGQSQLQHQQQRQQRHQTTSQSQTQHGDHRQQQQQQQQRQRQHQAQEEENEQQGLLSNLSSDAPFLSKSDEHSDNQSSPSRTNSVQSLETRSRPHPLEEWEEDPETPPSESDLQPGGRRNNRNFMTHDYDNDYTPRAQIRYYTIAQAPTTYYADDPEYDSDPLNQGEPDPEYTADGQDAQTSCHGCNRMVDEDRMFTFNCGHAYCEGCYDKPWKRDSCCRPEESDRYERREFVRNAQRREGYGSGFW